MEGPWGRARSLPESTQAPAPSGGLSPCLYCIWGPFASSSLPQAEAVLLFRRYFQQKFPCSVIRASFRVSLTSSTHQALLVGFCAVYFWLVSNFYGYFLFRPHFLNILWSPEYRNRLQPCNICLQVPHAEIEPLASSSPTVFAFTWGFH